MKKISGLTPLRLATPSKFTNKQNHVIMQIKKTPTNKH
jgi:hypothetical protein